MSQSNSRPDAGPGTNGHAPTAPQSTPDSRPFEDAPPTEPSPDVSEVRDRQSDEAADDEDDEDDEHDPESDDTLFVVDPGDEPPD